MMNSKRNQTIAIARFLMYKHSLNQQLDSMTRTRNIWPTLSDWMWAAM